MPETKKIISPFGMVAIIKGEKCTPAVVLEQIPIFRERGIKKANAIGDAFGVKGFGFWRTTGGAIDCSFDNARLILEDIDNQWLAESIGYDSAQQLQLKVAALADREELDEETLAALGVDSYDELIELAEDIPEPELQESWWEKI